MPSRKSEIVTFKVDENLLEAMSGVGNRSAFIRAAILSALENRCPLCQGEGVLSPSQMRHWRDFEGDHALEECEHCRELRLVCSR